MPAVISPVADECGPPMPVTLADNNPYRVQPGDVLELTLIGLQEDRYAPTVLRVRVHDNGEIELPVVGGVAVAKLTLEEAEQAIERAHVPSVVKSLAVFVDPVNRETTTVLVQGAVAHPGLVELKPDERNLLYAIVAAQGFWPEASGKVRVRHASGDRPEMLYDLNDPTHIRAALAAPPLETGDLVIVEAAEQSAVYMTGLIQRPGPLILPDGSELSVLRAIAAAGGIREYINVKEGTLVRRLANGEQVHVKLALGDMLAGKAPDIALKPGDILEVPHTADTLAQEWFVRNIQLGPFSLQLRYDPLAQYNANRAISANSRNGGTLNNAIRTSLATTIPSVIVPPVANP